MKKLLGAVVSGALLISLPGLQARADENPVPADMRLQLRSSDWDPVTSGEWDGQTWLFGANFTGGQFPGAPAPMIQDIGNSKFCDSLDVGCSPTEALVTRGYAELCTGIEVVTSCIKAVEFRQAGGEWVEAQFDRTWNAAPTNESFLWLNSHLSSTNHSLGTLLDVSQTSGWAENPEWKAPGSGAGPLVFSAPGIPNRAGTADYLVNLQYLAEVLPERRSTNYIDFELAITPIVITDYPEAHMGVELVTQAPGEPPVFGGTGPGFKDANFITEGQVAYSAGFARGFEARVVLEVPEAIGGWFHSRLSKPNLDLSPIGSNRNLLKIEGSYVEIPMTNAYVPGLDPDYKEIVEKYESPVWLERRRSGQASAGISGTVWGSNSGVEIFRDWQPYLDERAKGMTQAWMVSRMQPAQLGTNQCLNDTTRIQGLVNTNSMVYQAGIPEYSDGILRYQVAGVHRAMDGSLNIGEYDLQIRSEAARCIYGFSTAPVFAAVSVIDGEGKDVVATTVVSERDGWLKLAAYGFTFSEKEIQVKISQPQTKTLTNYVGSSTALTSKQKAQIKATIAKGGANSKFICTGIRLEGQSQALNMLVRKRAKLACDYAKSINPKLSTFYQTKTTKARSYNGKVLVVSK